MGASPRGKSTLASEELGVEQSGNLGRAEDVTTGRENHVLVTKGNRLIMLSMRTVIK